MPSPMPEPMPSPDHDDEESKIHALCPFCDGEYVVTSGRIRHSVPTCEPFEAKDGASFLKEVRKKEAHNAAAR